MQQQATTVVACRLGLDDPVFVYIHIENLLEPFIPNKSK